MSKDKTIFMDMVEPLRFVQIVTVPQTAIHTGGSTSIDELLGVTTCGDVMIFNKTTKSWLLFGG